ncbi:DUF3772 domain-containing protein [Citreicella sp. C3M06]|uniref:DUF3772 domain-containing protein n=1 Tax=Citreicella sp. C3M06 TaxID=2841564 RepID=UPI001C0941B6|nr:DUF3772 domain-containing protein [Citreicella sp. C3M06]MBU2962141.1 DUF3772 domain-containing protein [Citreicella sp. C3M06]
MSAAFRWLVAACVALTILAGAALRAQTTTLDYDSWNALANRAEQVIERAQASSEAFGALRSDVAGWRDTFLQAESTNAARIQTLQSQIAALGPAPADGESEAADIAERRASLAAELERLQVPVRRAQEAYTQADGLIGEIDQIVRNRQAQQYLELGPSPLNPALWGGALHEFNASMASLWAETRVNFASDVKQREARNSLPIIALLLASAALLVIRGPVWVRRLVEWLRQRTARGTGVWGFLASLAGIILPGAGLIALTVALGATGFVGMNGQRILELLPVWGITLLTVRWLAEQTFHHSEDVATLPLRPAQRREGRYYANILAVLLVLRSAHETLGEVFGLAPTTQVILEFPVLVLCALMLSRLGQILSRMTPDRVGEEAMQDESHFRLMLARVLGRIVIAIALIGPVMSAIGYDAVGKALVYPAIQTLAILAAVLVLQRFINDLYELITGKSAQGADSLLPVLAGLVLSLCALPLLALVWGARITDLTELWTRFREGFVFGETRISPGDFLSFVLVFAIGYGLTRLVQGGLRSTILPKTKIDPGGQTAIVSGLGYVGIFVAALVAITAAGLDLSSLAIVAGALSVGIGFGLQNIVSNFVSGIILLIERPISEGDWIEVGGTQGIVKSISVRSTRIETFDRTDLIVPNSDFVSGRVVNFTKGNVIGRVVVNVGVAYGTDTRRVEDILRSIVRQHDMVLLNPEPGITLEGFGESSLDFVIRAVIRDVGRKVIVASEFRHEIARRFAEEGIEIPFAQRDVWLRNPEVLHPEDQAAKARTPEPETQRPDDDTMPAWRDGDDGGEAVTADGDGGR